MQSIFYCNITTRFGCRPHPSSGVHNTVVTATGASHMVVQLPHFNVAKFGHGVRWLHEHMTCTSGCNYSVMYSWWVWTAPETCKSDIAIKYRLHIVACRWTFINVFHLNIIWLSTNRHAKWHFFTWIAYWIVCILTFLMYSMRVTCPVQIILFWHHLKYTN